MFPGDFEESNTGVEDDEFYADISEIKAGNTGFLARVPSAPRQSVSSLSSPNSAGQIGITAVPSLDRPVRQSIIISPAPLLPKSVPNRPLSRNFSPPKKSYSSNSEDEFRNDFMDPDDIYADIDEVMPSK